MIIRAYQLTRGCVFIKQGITYKVWKVSDRGIQYKHQSELTGNLTGEDRYIGKMSQERVELVSGEILPEDHYKTNKTVHHVSTYYRV